MNETSETTVLIPEIVRAEIARVDGETGLAPRESETLKQAFTTYFKDIEILKARAEGITVTNALQTREMKIARETRLALKENRVNVESLRKRLKEDSLRRGKAIDGYANVLKFLIQPTEDRLLEQEQFAERQEAARLAVVVEERTRQIIATGTDPNLYALAAMTDEQFTNTLIGINAAKEAIEAEKRRVEAARIAAKQAAAAERERLKQELAKAQAKAQTERQAREKAEKEARAAAVAAEKKAQVERMAIQAKLDAAQKARIAEQRKHDAELAAAKNREEHARLAEKQKAAAEAKAAKKAAAAPDRVKLESYAAAVEAIRIPDLAAIEANLSVGAERDAFLRSIRQNAAALGE